MKYAQFQKQYTHCYCRDCIEKRVGVRLKAWQCEYLPYYEKCRGCGVIRHIVTAVHPFVRWKICLRRVRKASRTEG